MNICDVVLVLLSYRCCCAVAAAVYVAVELVVAAITDVVVIVRVQLGSKHQLLSKLLEPQSQQSMLLNALAARSPPHTTIGSVYVHYCNHTSSTCCRNVPVHRRD